MQHPMLGLIVFVSALFPMMSHADAEAGRQKAEELCAPCHVSDGNSTNSQFPILAAQSARYIYLQLRDFKEGARQDPVMSSIAPLLSRQDMLNIAEWYSQQKIKPIAFTTDPARVARGQAKAEETLCTMCHLGGFKGQNEMPRVAGQYPEYVVKQLEAFKARMRTNDAGNMTAVAQTINEQDIIDLSHYLVSLQ